MERGIPHSCFLLKGQQDIADGYLEEFAIVVANCVNLTCFLTWTEIEILIMKFHIRMSLTTHWLLGSIITDNNYITLYVKYEKTDSA